MCLAAITLQGFAQFQLATQTRTEKTFNAPFGIFTRRFTIDLGKGNRMQVEVVRPEDLQKIGNIDSILRLFVKDMAPLGDTLGESQSSRRIDYILDSAGQRKIRILTHPIAGSQFLVHDGDLAALKLEQDSLFVTGTISLPISKWHASYRNYRIGLFLNQLGEISSYLDGRLNAQINSLYEHVNGRWEARGYNQVVLADDHSVSAVQPKGFFSGAGDYLRINAMVNLQNYKTYAIPSFTLGAELILANATFKREIGLFWEPCFFFARDAQNKMHTYKNDFLTLTLGQGPIYENDPRKASYLITIMSFGFLVNRQGDFFDKGTFRFGGGRLQLFEDKIRIEPLIYFHDLLKDVTPGIRFTARF